MQSARGACARTCPAPHTPRSPPLTQAARAAGADARQDHHIQLAPLERVHRLDEHLPRRGG